MSTTASHPRPHPRGSLDPRDTARALLQTEIERLPPEEREVVERFVARRKVARNISREFPASLSLGQRVADRVDRCIDAGRQERAHQHAGLGFGQLTGIDGVD